MNEGRILAANGFLNSSLIMQVSAFEAYMRDSFKLSYKNWFIYILDNNKDINENVKIIKHKIINIIDQMRLKNHFYDQIFLLGKYEYESELEKINDYNESLKNILFGANEEEQNTINKYISFQQLKDTFGCFWAYKHFFGLDLKSELDKKKYFEDLLRAFKIRHGIIHGSSRIQLHKELNQEIIKRNEEIILFIRKLVGEKFKEIDAKRKEFEGNNAKILTLIEGEKEII